MEKEFNGLANNGGIYVIYNFNNGKFYIGSTTCFKRRAYEHLKSLKDSKHFNTNLQNDYLQNNHNILFYVIESCNIENLMILEQKYLDCYFDNGLRCYNVLSDVGNWHKTKKTICRNHMSQAAKNRWIKDKEKILKQRNNADYRKKLSISKSTKLWSFVDPNGTLIEFVNLQKFCKEHNLQRKQMRWLFDGKIQQYKKWSNVNGNLKQAIIDKEITFQNKNNKRKKSYQLVRLDGTVVNIIGLKQFCRENSFHHSCFTRLMKNEIQSCYGFIRCIELIKQI